MLRDLAFFALFLSSVSSAQEAKPQDSNAHDTIDLVKSTDASNITKPSQSDMLVGTRVPRSLIWSAPTNQERLRVWWRGIAASPGSYIRATISAVPNHLSNTPADYGQGWDAFGKRYVNTFATYALQDTAAQGLAAVAHYEMRYIQCKCTDVMGRIRHALAFNFVTYDKDGKTVFNWPSIVGGYAVGMLSTTYTPNQKWSAEGIQAGNSAFYFGFASSLLQEFTPSKLFTHRTKHSNQAPAAPGTTPTSYTPTSYTSASSSIDSIQ